jgi:hypothetical protein
MTIAFPTLDMNSPQSDDYNLAAFLPIPAPRSVLARHASAARRTPRRPVIDYNILSFFCKPSGAVEHTVLET